MVISRRAGTDVMSPVTVAAGTTTVVFLKAGMNFETGSSMTILPSSISITAATLVMAFDIEAMRKMASFGIGTCFSRSSSPKLWKCATFPLRITSVTSPATCPSSTACFMAVDRRCSRSPDMPIDSGVALGCPCASAETVRVRTRTTDNAERRIKSNLMRGSIR